MSHTHNAALKMRSNNSQHRMLTRNVQSLTEWVWEPLSIKNEGIKSKQWSLFLGVYFMEFFVESTCKELRMPFHYRNGLSISHKRSSALKMLSNKMEHPMLTTEWAKSHKMGLGTSLNKKWRHQVKTMKWAIFFIELFIESIYLQERQHRNGPSISSTQLSSENTFNRVQSTWKSLCVATQWATCLTTWVWELVWTKNGASSQNDKSGQSVSTRVSGPARRMLRKILRAIFLEGRLTAPGG